MSKMRRYSLVAMILGLGATGAPAQYLEQQKLTASDAEAVDEFGVSVSVSGDTAVVGAYLNDCAAGSFCGAAYVSRFSGSSWVEQQKLTATNAAERDEFGYSVSVSGDTVMVGAPASDRVFSNSRGAAYVFRFDGTSWIEKQKLTASDASMFDRFGASVSVSGNIAIVGAQGRGCAVPGTCGSAYVFRFNGFSWIEEQKLTASDVNVFDTFGESVSLSGETAVIGSSMRRCMGDAQGNCGAAYVFRFNGTTWVEEQILIASDAADASRFGGSVSVQGGTVLVGAPSGAFVEGNCCGAAYVFRFNGTSWVEEQRLTASDGSVRDSFGQSVSVNGNMAVIGADRARGPDGRPWGSAYVFSFDGTFWVEEEKLTASDAAFSDLFGHSVSVSGNTALVGAPSADCAAGLNCGSAYVFRVPEAADFDRDGDVDLFDFASFQAQFAGDLFDFVSLHAQFTGPQ